MMHMVRWLRAWDARPVRGRNIDAVLWPASSCAGRYRPSSAPQSQCPNELRSPWAKALIRPPIWKRPHGGIDLVDSPGILGLICSGPCKYKLLKDRDVDCGTYRHSIESESSIGASGVPFARLVVFFLFHAASIIRPSWLGDIALRAHEMGGLDTTMM